MLITRAESADLEKILFLQYMAYESEAKLLNNYSIQPMKQTLDELIKEFKEGTILKAVDEDGTIIGSVRGYVEGDTIYVGKLMVHPEYQKQGIGKQLLETIEKLCPKTRYELFTSSRSASNLRLYSRVGYQPFKEKKISTELTFIYLEKHLTI